MKTSLKVEFHFRRKGDAQLVSKFLLDQGAVFKPASISHHNKLWKLVIVIGGIDEDRRSALKIYREALTQLAEACDGVLENIAWV